MDKLKSIEDGIDRDEEFKKIKNGSFENQVLEYQELYPLDEYPGKFPVRILKNRFSTYFNHYSNGVENTLKKMNGDRIIDKIIWVFEEEKMQIPNCSMLGAGICGRNAGELISEAVLALEMGAVAQDISLSIHPHPTLSETFALAAELAEGTATDTLNR